MNPPQCFRCGKTAEELAEYVDAADDWECTPSEYVVAEEGTYNPATNTFACTPCYSAIGMPSSERGWKAPRLGASL